MALNASAGDQPAIALVRKLCRALDVEGVGYCHWKSNAFLHRSRTAENDLDLLVRRADGDRFSAIVHDLGFKQAWSPSGSLPGVLNYYGYDQDADRFVHVHAHYQLIVGDDLTKNYRIPLENALLDTATHEGEFRVPQPELELVLLVIRLVLKHSTWDALLARRGRAPASALRELVFLEARVDEDRLYRFLEELLPFVDRHLFSGCVRALAVGSSTWERVRAGQRLVAALRPCARRSRAADIRLKLWRRGAGIGRRLLARPARRKQLVSGGALIAIVGADGAGKSTAVEALSEWLTKSFAVTCIHLGKPPRSWTTVVVTSAARVPSGLAALLSRLRRPRPGGEGRESARSKPRAAVAVALARDRYHAYRSARRIATNGGLVICDRFPLPQLTLMDAPRVERMIRPGQPNRLARRLSVLERRYYEAMARPDVLIVLRVDPEVAVARKVDEPPDFVRARWREIWDVDWSTVPAHVVDASRSREDVLSSVKSLVWSEV